MFKLALILSFCVLKDAYFKTGLGKTHKPCKI